MLQRKQTLYLLLVVVLTSITFFLPVGGLTTLAEEIIYKLNYQGLYGVYDAQKELYTTAWMLTVLMAIIPIFTLIIIFLYKKRVLQIRLLFFNIVLMLGFYAMLFLYLWQYGKILDARLFVEFPAAFPLVGIILSIMAIRSIAKDEALIKSLNRLR